MFCYVSAESDAHFEDAHIFLDFVNEADCNQGTKTNLARRSPRFSREFGQKHKPHLWIFHCEVFQNTTRGQH